MEKIKYETSFEIPFGAYDSELIEETISIPDGYSARIEGDKVIISMAKEKESQKNPKFKVGDFIVNDYCMGKVIELTNDAYLLDTGQGIPFSCEHSARLWTIEDAKDGDVLVASDDSIFLFAGVVDCACKYYVAITTDNYVKINKEVEGGYWETSRAVHPATKEQCDLLFSKMKEAGYEWDANKKELKKIKEERPLLSDFFNSEYERGKADAIKEMKSVWSEEDERIRKSLIHFFSNPENTSFEYWEGISKKEVLVWLEKQGEEKLPIEKLPEEMKTVGESLGFTTQEECDDYNKMVTDLIMSDDDTIETKFKVGDWITNGIEAVQITGYDIDYGYQVDYKGDLQHRDTDIIEKEYHLWVIDDVKEGDILAGKIDGYSYILIYKQVKDEWIETYGHYYNIVDRFCVPSQLFCRNYQGVFTPATKEQRDLLFSKMEEAGYEWDEEKKELKKIESKSSCGEEDERTRKEIIYHIQHCDDTIDEQTEKRMIAWLEKQSKENMIEALRLEYEKGKADALQEQRKEWTSEDLLNRNEIADILQEYNRDDLIDWLKKQASVKEIVERCKNSWYNEGKIAGMAEGLTDDEKYQQGWHDALEKQGNDSYLQEKIENFTNAHKGEDPEVIIVACRGGEEQGEHKPVNEPKFEVGNWYQCTKDFFGKGVTFDKNTAYYCAQEGCLQNEYGCHIAIVKDLYDNFKLWTIEDVKDGDVLYSEEHNLLWIYKDKEAYHACINLNYGVPSSLGGVIVMPNDTCPATKEQRDLLFAKMKEEGYEWDADKKKVKIIDFGKHLKYESNPPSILKDGDFVEELAYKLQELLGGNAAGARYLAKDWAKDLLPLVK